MHAWLFVQAVLYVPYFDIVLAQLEIALLQSGIQMFCLISWN